MKRPETLAILEAVLAITLWAVSFVFMKIALREISAATMIAIRFAMGAALVGLAAWRKGDFARLRRADMPRLALLGFVGITLQQLLQVSGQATSDASVAAFLASTAPAFTVALAALVLREKPGLWQIFGVALATVGAVVVSTGGDVAALLPASVATLLPVAYATTFKPIWSGCVFAVVAAALAGAILPALHPIALALIAGGARAAGVLHVLDTTPGPKPQEEEHGRQG